MDYPKGRRCFFCIVVMCLCVVSAKHVDNNNARSKRTAESCDNAKQFFSLRNITVSAADGSKGSICGGQCCDDYTESLLRKQGQRDFASLLRHNSRSLQGQLNSTAATLHIEDDETPYDSDENIELDDDIESEGYSTD